MLPDRAKNKSTRWLCKCDCGSNYVVPSNSLRGGNTKSCGCLSPSLAGSRQLVQMAGMRFSHLVVQREDVERTKDGKVRWHCRCDCGNEKSISGKDIRSGATKSCGCLGANHRVIDLTGRVFGRLTALRRDASRINGVYWLCKCSCGGEKSVVSGSLTKGMTVSCGCAIKDQPGLMPKHARERSAAITQLRRARKRLAGGKFTREQIADLYSKQRGCCAWCGLKLGDVYHRDHRVSLSAGGSNDISNMEILCPTCNLRKGAKDPISWANEMGRLC